MCEQLEQTMVWSKLTSGPSSTKMTHTNKIVYKKCKVNQRCTNPGNVDAVSTKFSTIAPNLVG